MVHDSVGSWSVFRSVLRAMKKRHVVQAKTRKDVQFQYMKGPVLNVFRIWLKACSLLIVFSRGFFVSIHNSFIHVLA